MLKGLVTVNSNCCISYSGPSVLTHLSGARTLTCTKAQEAGLGYIWQPALLHVPSPAPTPAPPGLQLSLGRCALPMHAHSPAGESA